MKTNRPGAFDFSWALLLIGLAMALTATSPAWAQSLPLDPPGPDDECEDIVVEQECGPQYNRVADPGQWCCTTTSRIWQILDTADPEAVTCIAAPFTPGQFIDTTCVPPGHFDECGGTTYDPPLGTVVNGQCPPLIQSQSSLVNMFGTACCEVCPVQNAFRVPGGQCIYGQPVAEEFCWEGPC